jgi:hypothetical protein
VAANRQDTSARPGVTPACVACKSKCGWPPPNPPVGVFTIHANLGYVRPEKRTFVLHRAAIRAATPMDLTPDDGRVIQQRKPAHTDWPDRLGRSQRWQRLSLIRGSTAGPPGERLGPLWDHTLCT